MHSTTESQQKRCVSHFVFSKNTERTFLNYHFYTFEITRINNPMYTSTSLFMFIRPTRNKNKSPWKCSLAIITKHNGQSSPLFITNHTLFQFTICTIPTYTTTYTHTWFCSFLCTYGSCSLSLF
eukprot:UN32917